MKICPSCSRVYPIGDSCPVDGTELVAQSQTGPQQPVLASSESPLSRPMARVAIKRVRVSRDSGRQPAAGQPVTGPHRRDSASFAAVQTVRSPDDVLGTYRIVRLIAEGGMGRVYEAEHQKLGRRVALKLLHAEYAGNATALARFFREARAVNQIRHENIVEINDFVEEPGGDSYYIMELLEGESLGQRLKGGPLPLASTLKIGLQIASALAKVHEAEIVHRDIKPDNIYLIERGEQRDFVKVLDFGIVKLLGEGAEAALDVTKPGAILGTPEYMSPEQAAVMPVDHRADIYGIGLLLYEMLTGKRPLTGESFGDLLVQRLTGEIARPSSLGAALKIPPDLEALIMACLQRSPDKRPQTAREVLQALRSVIAAEEGAAPAGHATSTVTPLVLESTAKLVSLDDGLPSRTPLYVLGAVAVLLGVALAWLLLHRSPPEAAQLTSRQPLASANERSDASPAPPTRVARAPDAQAPDLRRRRVMVSVTLSSKPKGAQVFVAGQAQPLGKTPLSLSFEKSQAPKAFEFRLRGHRSVRKPVQFVESVAVVAVRMERGKGPAKPLVAAKRAGRAAGKNGAKPGTGSAAATKIRTGKTLDPFGK